MLIAEGGRAKDRMEASSPRRQHAETQQADVFSQAAGCVNDRLT